jgi:adenosine deaminase/adenosine deaminase CECR1
VGHFGEGLLELKNRAIKENVSYIETEFSTILVINTSDLLGFNTQLRLLANNRKRVKALLDTLYSKMLKGCGSRCSRFQHELCSKITQ